MFSPRKFSVVILLLFVSTFLVSFSFAETEEEGWTTVRPEFRPLLWCGTGTVYASIHRIQPISFGGIRLRGGTLFRLHGPHFEIRSMFTKAFDNLDESFDSSFPDDINNEHDDSLSLASEKFYESDAGGRNVQTKTVSETDAMETATVGETERDRETLATLATDVEISDEIEGTEVIEGREVMASVGGEREWKGDVWNPNVEEGEGEGKWSGDVGRDERPFGFQQNQGFEFFRDRSPEETPEWEHSFETEVVDPRNSLEEQTMRNQLGGELKRVGVKFANQYENDLEARDLKNDWQPPSEEALTDILRYILMVFIFVAAFVLVALVSSRRDLPEDDATVLVLNAPDHSTPLLQTYVVGEQPGDSVETGQMENGVVLYQPPEVGTEEKK